MMKSLAPTATPLLALAPSATRNTGASSSSTPETRLRRPNLRTRKTTHPSSLVIFAESILLLGIILKFTKLPSIPKYQTCQMKTSNPSSFSRIPGYSAQSANKGLTKSSPCSGTVEPSTLFRKTSNLSVMSATSGCIHRAS